MRLLLIHFENSNLTYLTKDMCSYPYYLGKNHGWDCTYGYFTSGNKLENDDFEKYCKLLYLGEDVEYSAKRDIIKQYLREHAIEYDVLSFFNYGGATYKLALYAKKVNPKIIVYNKLDMGEGGFSHFYDGSFIRKIHLLPEYWKSRGIDLFTVENIKFYNVLRNMKLFSNRLEYLPNMVSMFGVDANKIKSKSRKNRIITIGRLGSQQKNNELFMEALCMIDPKVLSDWEIYLVGRDAGNFKEYVEKIVKNNSWLNKKIIFTGEIYDRNKLYELCAESRIICMSSRWESFGIATIEGMYWGAYPIITNYGSIAYDITDNENYGIVTEHNAKSMSIALNKIITQNNLDELNNEIMSYAEKKFNCDYWACKLNEYLLAKINR